jgi:hypothetical protein
VGRCNLSMRFENPFLRDAGGGNGRPCRFATVDQADMRGLGYPHDLFSSRAASV